jgi:PAS domain S-box-containing protein
MQAQQVAIANQIIKALRETQVIDEVANHTVNQVQIALQVDCCLLLQSHLFEAAGGEYGSAQVNHSMSAHYAFCRVFRKQLLVGQAIIYAKAEIDSALPAELQKVLRECDIRAVMILPLLSGDSYLGAMGLYPVAVDRQWTTEEVAFGRAIADYLAVFIEQTRLKEQVQNASRLADFRKIQEPDFKALVEQSSDAIARYDQSLRYVYANPATEKDLGYRVQEMLGKTDRELGLPEDTLMLWETALQQTFATQHAQTFEVNLPSASGLRYFQAHLIPEVGTTGDVEFVVSVCRDITERKRAEEDSKLLKTMTQAIFESEDFHSALQVALQKVCEATRWEFGEAWVPCADKTFLESSSAFYSKHEALLEFRQLSQCFTFAPGVGIPGRVWLSQKPEWCQDVSVQTEAIYRRAQMAEKFGLKAALGIPILTHEAVLTVLVFYMFEAREEDERLIQLISASTELGLFIQRKQAEGEIRKSLLRERELSQLKSNFIAMVSHEFRTPLSSIVLSAELLERYGDRYEAEKKEAYLKRIQMSTKRMTQLLESVLLLEQTESGGLRFNPAPLDLEKFCRDLIGCLQPEGSNYTPILFSYQPEPYHPVLDENLLQHILSNLLSNAIKYSPNGGTVEFEIGFEVTDELASAVIFKIQDHGIGIPLSDQARLFEPFHRATNVSTISGTGLGLSIVKQCVELHQGQINVSSELGVGTIFTVRLPLSVLEGNRGYDKNPDY